MGRRKALSARIPDSLRRAMISFHQQGLTCTEIAMRTGYSSSAVSSAVFGSSKKDLDPDTRKMAFEMKKLDESGYKRKEIAKMYGVSPTTVTKYIRATDFFDNADKTETSKRAAAIAKAPTVISPPSKAADDPMIEALTKLQSLILDFLAINDYKAVKILAEAAIKLQEEKKNETV